MVIGGLGHGAGPEGVPGEGEMSAADVGVGHEGLSLCGEEELEGAGFADGLGELVGGWERWVLRRR